MDKKIKNKILKGYDTIFAAFSEVYSHAILNVIIESPRITKEELANYKLCTARGRKLPSLINEYIAQKYIDYVNSCTK